MTLVQELFAEYVFAERDGNGDPRPFLKRAEPADREQLAEMIDSYLATAPGRKWDPDAFQGSRAQALTESLDRALNGVSGTWPVVLPSLRERAQIKRADLVRKLAEKLGFPDQRQVVGEYYHGMEYGTLDSAGVNGRVLDVLGDILGTGGDALRRSGELIGAGGGQAMAETVFTRAVTPTSETFESEDAGDLRIEAASERRTPDSDSDRKAVVELFTGGG